MKKDYNVNNGFVRKYELAMEYFPYSPSKKAATDNLARAIDRCNTLKKAMEESKSGYNASNKYFTPLQVRLILDYLGEPWAAGGGERCNFLA